MKIQENCILGLFANFRAHNFSNKLLETPLLTLFMNNFQKKLVTEKHLYGRTKGRTGTHKFIRIHRLSLLGVQKGQKYGHGQPFL